MDHILHPSSQLSQVQTARLLLRPLNRADLAAYHRLRSNPTIMRYSRNHRPDVDEAYSWTKLAPLINVAEDKSASATSAALPPPADQSINPCGLGIELLSHPGVLVGDVAVHEFTFERAPHTGTEGMPTGARGHWVGEIGYMLEPELWGKGMATEAVRGFVDHFWAHHTPALAQSGIIVSKLLAHAEEGNGASHTVLKKCGFRDLRRFTHPRAGEDDDRLVEYVLERPSRA